MNNQKPLNVVMVLADQHHADLLGCAGHPQVKTPRIDQFAQNAVRFSRAYCQNPICTPSRVSILSGQYPHNTGCFGLGGPSPSHIPSLFNHLRRHGYRTAGFGKLHLPLDPQNWVSGHVDRFGDTYETADGRVGESAYLTELESLGLRDREDSWHNTSGRYGPQTIGRDARPSDMPYEHTQERWCVREALAFAAEAKSTENPFFIQVAFQKPHHPLLPVQQFWDLYNDDLELPPTFDQNPEHRTPNFQQMFHSLRDETPWTYGKPGDTYRDGAQRAWRGTLACISQVDDVFGILLDGLAEHGLRDDTIIVYGSDHGCFHTMHGLPEKAPGIGADAVCRVPLFISVPRMTNPGRVCGQLVENLDLAPTITSLCGIPTMDSSDGYDLKPMLQGDDTPIRQAAFTENPLSKAVRFGPYRLTHYPDKMYEGKYLGELYHLENDPNETTNLYENPDYSHVVSQGIRLILDWLAETTRVTSCMPMQFNGNPRLGKRSYTTAEDGKLPRALQPGRKTHLDALNYM